MEYRYVIVWVKHVKWNIFLCLHVKKRFWYFRFYFISVGIAIDRYVIKDIMVRLGGCRGYHFDLLLLFSFTKLVGGITQILAWPIKTNTGAKTDDKSARYYCRFWTYVGNNFSPRWELTTAAGYGVRNIDPPFFRCSKNLELTCERVN